MGLIDNILDSRAEMLLFLLFGEVLFSLPSVFKAARVLARAITPMILSALARDELSAEHCSRPYVMTSSSPSSMEQGILLTLRSAYIRSSLETTSHGFDSFRALPLCFLAALLPSFQFEVALAFRD